MKKFYLFSVGLLLASAPMVAQTQVEGPTRTSEDPVILFEQGFEDDWDAWIAKEVDKIDTLWYYTHKGDSSTSSISSSWPKEFIVRTDSVIPMYNGVVTSDDKKDWTDAKGAYGNDVYTILSDEAGSARRAELQKNFGIDPGTHYFQYNSDVKLYNTSGYSTSIGYDASAGVASEYRRNLFVRGLPIEDHSSYRLTMYVKVQQPAATNVTPTFTADLMRGYFHSEKGFYTGADAFSYTQTDFSGNWEKINFMSYYINDEVQEQAYNKEYYWSSDEWKWDPDKTGDKNQKYYFIKQPDKFFARLAFRSDSTLFQVDNISLTKSWIGGVEYSGNKIRVDFGYETNLNDLAQAAYAETNIAAVQLPGENFQVLGYYEGEGVGDEAHGWWEIPINSAEYHGDGYLYMWTEEDEEGDPITFDYYDTVLVSFFNPEDPALCLKYTSSKYYPMADDTTWAKTKLVPDFYNEVATLNPFVFEGVYSMKELPPVFQEAPWENNSFGLDGSITELNIKMSRHVEFDPNADEYSELAYCRVTGPSGKEIWTVQSSDEDGNTVFIRPSDKTEPLKGTYKFEFLLMKDKNTGYGDPFTLNYDFGPYEKHPDTTPVFATSWRSNCVEEGLPAGFATWDKTNGYKVGDGTKYSNIKLRVYYTDPSTSGGLDCGLYISSRGQKQGGHLYYGTEEDYKLHLAAGTYTISFSAANWDGYECPVTFYVYPRSKYVLDGTPKTDDGDRVAVATFWPDVKVSSSNIQKTSDPYGSWDNTFIDYAFDFSVAAEDDYVIEWQTQMGASGNAQSYGGILMSDFTIIKSLGLSFGPISAFNKAIAAAEEKIALANEDKYEATKPYSGATLESFTDFVADAKANFESTAPSVWAAKTADIKNATNVMQQRMDTVDLYYSSEDAAIKKLAEYDLLTELQKLEAYKNLDAYVTAQEGYNCPDYESAEIAESAKQFDDLVKALDDRKALNDKWDAKVKEVGALVTDSLAQKGLVEYGEMALAYKDALGIDVITPSNELFEKLYTALCEAENGYLFKVDYIAAKTRQAKDLAALAKKLGYEIPADVQDLLDGLQDEDASLEALLRDAAILQIYKKFADGNELIDENVSALVPNYFLYNDADLERDMEKNSSGYWRIKNNVTSTTALPHWSITPTTGNWYPCKEKAVTGTANVGRLDWETEGHVFDGGVRCGPTTQGTLTSTVEDLPAAYYWVGFYGYNQTSNFFFSAVGDSSSYNPGLSAATGKFNYKEFGADSIKTATKITYTIKQNSSSQSEADIRYFVLKLRGLSEDVNYAELIDAQEEKVNGDITFVAPATQEVEAKYYNPNGMQIAPKAGQIMIKQTIGKNGAISTEKYLAE